MRKWKCRWGYQRIQKIFSSDKRRQQPPLKNVFKQARWNKKIASSNARISFIRFQRQWGDTVAASTEEGHERNYINAKQGYRNQTGVTYFKYHKGKEYNYEFQIKAKTGI